MHVHTLITTVMPVEVLVGPEGGEDWVEVDVNIAGHYVEAEPDVGVLEDIEDVYAWTYGPDGTAVDFELTEDEHDRAVELLLEVWRDR